MFQTSYVHHQEDHIVHAALHDTFSMRLGMPAVYQIEGCAHVRYILPDDEHMMFKTCRRQEEFN